MTVSSEEVTVKRPNAARKTAKFSKSVSHQLNAYSLAAGAAGVSLLALTQPAEARIIYTTAHVKIVPNNQYDLDLNHDGINDFIIAAMGATQGSWLRCYPFAGTGTNGPVGGDGINGSAFALRAGDNIGPKERFIGLYMAEWFRSRTRSSFAYQWANGGKGVKDRYLGLEFEINGVRHYGWARLNVTFSKFAPVGLLTGYAYETVPNKAIIAGKTKGKDVVTVQPASLGHLARGAQTISAWRGTDSVAAVH